jgi:excisionase family DNA binding protein
MASLHNGPSDIVFSTGHPDAELRVDTCTELTPTANNCEMPCSRREIRNFWSFFPYGGTQLPKPPHDMVMTIGDLARYLKLSKSTLYKLCAEGKVPGTKVGRHWRFRKEIIDHWLGEVPRDTKKAVLRK